MTSQHGFSQVLWEISQNAMGEKGRSLNALCDLALGVTLESHLHNALLVSGVNLFNVECDKQEAIITGAVLKVPKRPGVGNVWSVSHISPKK